MNGLQRLLIQPMFLRMSWWVLKTGLFQIILMQDMLNKIGVSKVNFEYVNNYLIAIVRK